jgi:phage terminase small subunit
MKSNNLTIKQEKFCQAYIRFGDKSAAYREAYSTSKMKSETVNRNSFKLFNDNKITTRIEFLQKEISKRNKIEIDELVIALSGMVRFDVAELYDESGALKNIHEMPLSARQMITQLDTFEQYNSKGEFQGTTKKIRTIQKLDAIEKLMKYLGAYEKDNNQKKIELNQNIDVSKLSNETLEELEKAYSGE